LLGHGPGSFPTSFPQFEIAGYTRSAHQSWLQIAAESGWPSLGFLIGAIVCGLMNAHKYLRDRSRPHRAWIGAGAGAALVAAVVHGMMDAGWGILSIALLLCVCLALLDAPHDAPHHSALESALEAPDAAQSFDDGEQEGRRRLGWNWLVLLVPLAAAASYGLKAQGAENARQDSRAALQSGQSGAREEALKIARRATNDVPLDARAWANEAQIEESVGNKLGASLDYGRASKLQPGKALYPARIAAIFDAWKRPELALDYWDQAVALDQNCAAAHCQVYGQRKPFGFVSCLHMARHCGHGQCSAIAWARARKFPDFFSSVRDRWLHALGSPILAANRG
jgi:hypothetical protein